MNQSEIERAQADALVNSIRREVWVQVRRTASLVAYPPPDLIRCVIRVEINPETERKLLRWIYENTMHPSQVLGEGPYVIEDTSWYVVNHLPEPGWRVINPLIR